MREENDKGNKTRIERREKIIHNSELGSSVWVSLNQYVYVQGN